MKKLIRFLLIVFLSSIYAFDVFAQPITIRVGHFPNITHAPALVAKKMGYFEKALGSNYAVDWKIFNAGPEAMEALLAGELDFLYVGPNPAVNGFVRSKGEAVKILAGTAAGGSAFVVRKDSNIKRFEDISGKRVASPQKGNSQDVALIHLIREKNLSLRHEGGNVEIFNISGGDQITAFQRKEIDGIWTIEPWVSRLVSEADGHILFEESELWPEGKYATTLFVVRKKFMDKNPELVQRWIGSYVSFLDWFNQNYTQAKKIFNEELKIETGKELPSAYLEKAFGRIQFSYEPMKEQVLESAKRAAKIGYLGKNHVDLAELYELSFLEKAKNESKK